MSAVNQVVEFLRKSSRPALFAGAGVSMRAGLPSWPGLLNQIANQVKAADAMAAAHIEHTVRDGDMLYAATLFTDNPKFTPVKKRQILKDLLTASTIDKVLPITRLPFGAVFTTNFDRVLFDAYATSKGIAPIDHYYGSTSFISSIIETDFHVTRLHGRLEGQDAVVFSTADYQRVLSDPSYLDVLRHIFTQRQLLIVGFSFIDPAFQTVLEAIEKIYNSRAIGNHLAIVPDDAEDSFLSKLSRFNIAQVKYSPKDGHAELWEIIAQTASELSKVVPESNSSIETPADGALQPGKPLQPIRRFLSSTYARLELHEDAEALRDSTLEGVVLGMIASSPNGLTKDELTKHFENVLGLDNANAFAILKKALSNLRVDKLVTREKDGARGEVFKGDATKVQNPLSEALLSLCLAIDDRVKLMFGIRTTTDMRECIRVTLTNIIESRGWDLGAAFLRGAAPADIDVDHHVREAGGLISLDKLSSISSAVRHLLVFPTPTEAKLLTEIGRASFAISLIYSAPRTAISQGSLLPDIIYLDASVLLPALVRGHRFHALYKATMDGLAKLVKQAGKKVRLVVYEGYLNEVVSHRRKAISEFEMEDAGFREYAIRRAKLEGAQNLNVFVGAYAQQATLHPELSFTEFLEKEASYVTETELADQVKRLGIAVVPRHEIVGKNVSDVSFELTKAYAVESERYKATTLIDHDAVQLSALSFDAEKGARSLWITADMRLRSKLVGPVLSSIADHVMSHFGLAQIVDFISDYKPPSFGMAGLLWGVRPSEPAARVRDLLISEALEFYDEAYAMEMHVLVDGVSERWEKEARRRGVSLDSSDPKSRAEAVRLVGGFQDEFISALNEKVAKRQAE